MLTRTDGRMAHRDRSSIRPTQREAGRSKREREYIGGEGRGRSKRRSYLGGNMTQTLMTAALI